MSLKIKGQVFRAEVLGEVCCLRVIYQLWKSYMKTH